MKKVFAITILLLFSLLVYNPIHAQLQIKVQSKTEKTGLFEKGIIDIQMLNGSGDYTVVIADKNPLIDNGNIKKEFKVKGNSLKIEDLKIKDYFLVVSDNNSQATKGKKIVFD